MAASRFSPPATPLLAGERYLPDDVLQRVLVGLPLDDHRAAASVCKSFRGIVTGPRFLAARRRYGFAERGIVSIKRSPHGGDLTICMAHRGETARITGNFHLSTGSTTDGGSRLFVSATNTISNHQIEHGVWAVDASSRRWRRFATVPHGQGGHSLEWHNGLLYVAGGIRDSDDSDFSTTLNSLRAFNEATGLWDDLPPMLHACEGAASGVIGNELFIAGGYHEVNPVTLQIYDIPSRRWRLGAALPEPRMWAIGVVADGNLFVISTSVDSSKDLLVYDPQSDTWTEAAPPPTVTNNTRVVKSACAHKGRLVVFLSNGTAWERANDGSWSPYEVAAGLRDDDAAESVILG